MWLSCQAIIWFLRDCSGFLQIRSHIGLVRMKIVARSYVWWTKLDKDIEQLVKSCSHCQAVQNLPPMAPLHPWIWPAEPWKRIHIDFASLFLGRSFLVVVDSYSKWPEIFQMKSTATAATVLQLRRLFSAYGLPEQLVSDNGPQFSSTEFTEFLSGETHKISSISPFIEWCSGTFYSDIQEVYEIWQSPRITI